MNSHLCLSLLLFLDKDSWRGIWLSWIKAPRPLAQVLRFLHTPSSSTVALHLMKSRMWSAFANRTWVWWARWGLSQRSDKGTSEATCFRKAVDKCCLPHLPFLIGTRSQMQEIKHSTVPSLEKFYSESSHHGCRCFATEPRSFSDCGYLVFHFSIALNVNLFILPFYSLPHPLALSDSNCKNRHLWRFKDTTVFFGFFLSCCSPSSCSSSSFSQPLHFFFSTYCG